MPLLRERLTEALDAFAIVNVPGEGRVGVQRSREELADAALAALGLDDLDAAVERGLAYADADGWRVSPRFVKGILGAALKAELHVTEGHEFR